MTLTSNELVNMMAIFSHNFWNYSCVKPWTTRTRSFSFSSPWLNEQFYLLSTIKEPYNGFFHHYK